MNMNGKTIMLKDALYENHIYVRVNKINRFQNKKMNFNKENKLIEGFDSDIDRFCEYLEKSNVEFERDSVDTRSYGRNILLDFVICSVTEISLDNQEVISVLESPQEIAEKIEMD